jgi:argininosuccinate lyase
MLPSCRCIMRAFCYTVRMSTITQQRAMIDEARIRETAKNIIALFLMEQGMPFAKAHAAAASQVKDSSLNLLKKILSGGVR